MWQVMAAGTLLNMYGNYMQGQSEAKSLLSQANDARVKSAEQYRRYEYNVGLEKENLRQTLSGITTSAAAKGVRGQLVEGIQDYTSVTVAKNLAEMKKEADWNRKMAELEARSYEQAASDKETASFFGLLGGGLSGAGQAYSIYNKK